jgi:hypothetical protein
VRVLTIATRVLLTLAIISVAAAQGFKPYPGATKYTPPDNEEARRALKDLPPGATATSYTTPDSFEKVVAFYKSFAKQYDMPHQRAGAKLANGQELQRTFFIFDGATDITTSKSWAKVQHPFIGGVEFQGGAPQYKDVRDVTEITVTQKK